MESSRFDAFTRGLAAVLNRRGALGVLASLFALLGEPFGLGTSEAKKKKAKGCRKVGKKCGHKRNRKCCSHAKCRGGRCKCTGQKKACRGKCIPQSQCCDNADCGGGATCHGGVCNCVAGQKPCNGVCIPEADCCTASDCGECESCQSGTCVPGCETGQECVSGTCRCTTTSCSGCCDDDETCQAGNDPDVCGADGETCIECPANESCPDGACICEAPHVVCGGDCVNPNTDDNHCGRCDNACVGSATCESGACAAGGVYTFVRKWNGGGPGLEFNHPLGIAVDGVGNVYVTDEAVNRIQKFAADGAFLDDWSSNGNTPIGIAVNRATGEIYVANASSDTIQTFDGSGTPGISWSTGSSPEGVAVNPSTGESYVALDVTNSVQRFTSEGDLIEEWLSPPYTFDFPVGVAVAPNGDVYVSNNGSCEIQRFTADGVLLDEWGTEGSGPGEFENPAGIAVDAAGDIYVCDSGNFRIQKFTATGDVMGEFGSQGDGDGEFEFP
jgi:streptogramin lyase